jgi:hypothetical protein
VELEIRPEPSPEEREAIAAALEAALAGGTGGLDLGPWWKAGLREELDGSEYAE